MATSSTVLLSEDSLSDDALLLDDPPLFVSQGQHQDLLDRGGPPRFQGDAERVRLSALTSRRDTQLAKSVTGVVQGGGGPCAAIVGQCYNFQ